MSLRSDRIIRLARQEIGTSEGRSQGHWNNRVRYTAGTSHAGQPWCLWFCVWVMRAALVPITVVPNIGSVSALHQWARIHERLVRQPRPGDIVLLNGREWSARPVHCGIVELVHTDGTVQTIEGNTNADGSAEGHTVMRRTRSPGRIVATVSTRPAS